MTNRRLLFSLIVFLSCLWGAPGVALAQEPVRLDGIGVRGSDDLGDFVPVGAHETAEAALARIGRALLGTLDNRRPGGDRRAQGTRFAPELEQARTHERIFHPVAGIEDRKSVV